MDLFSRFVCAAGDILRNKRILHYLSITALPNAKGKQWLGHQCKRTYVPRESTLHNFPLIMLTGIITTSLNCVNMLLSPFHFFCPV